MDQKRSQAYLNLINQLLTCNQGDEPQILQENQQLLDQGLIEVMVAVAQKYEEEGKEKGVQWVINMAQQLAEALGLLKDENTFNRQTFEEYFNFLMEVLQKVADNPSTEIIYPFLKQNLDKLDNHLIGILENWATHKLSSFETEEAEYIAGVIGEFSHLIQQFPLGKIATNLELAITGYEIALTIFKFEAFPVQWATIQNNLATAYSERIRGDKADNLEQAITYYQQALKVKTFEAFPVDWAATQNNLANAYLYRIRGYKAHNLEQAIAYYQQALKVRTFEAFPVDWAMTQNNLATAYLYRIRGDKADNLEQAIAYYQQALKVKTFEAFPVDWAMTQNNLATAYLYRIRGDKAHNIEQSIAYYQQALKVRTFEAFPVDWAMTQNNLATAYFYRIRGDKADNLEQAIAYYQQALKVRIFEAFPVDWATTQNNLAIAYSDRIRGDKADNLEQAIICYQNALQGFETGGDWLKAATTALILGKIEVDKGQWHQGLTYLEKSLKIYRLFKVFKSRADTIYQIAHTHHLMGNHEKATLHYRDAKRLYDYLKNERGAAFCQASLGRLMLQIGFVDKAQELLENARITFEKIDDQQEIEKLREVFNCITKIKGKKSYE